MAAAVATATVPRMSEHVVPSPSGHSLACAVGSDAAMGGAGNSDAEVPGKVAFAAAVSASAPAPAPAPTGAEKSAGVSKNSRWRRRAQTGPGTPPARAPASPTPAGSQSPSLENARADFEFGRVLGEGTFGRVMLATHLPTGATVAVKVLNKAEIKTELDLKRILREVTFLNSLTGHPHIANIYQVFETRSEIFLVIEYCRGGEVFEYIVAHKRVREPEAKKFFVQILSALHYCHLRNIAHRDLKPENLLIDEHKNIKLIDFGLANIFKGDENLSTFCGSRMYAAPEVLSKTAYTGVPADMWSLGCVLFAMVSGFLPFESLDSSKNTAMHLHARMMNRQYQLPSFLSAHVKDLIRNLLQPDPQRRLSLRAVLAHPWLQDIDVCWTAARARRGGGGGGGGGGGEVGR